MAKLAPGTAWAPVDWEPADAKALQNMRDGTATPEQQQRAMRWILLQAAAVDDFHYRHSERDTAFSLGRAFVGQQIRKLWLLNVSRIVRIEDDNSNGGVG